MTPDEPKSGDASSLPNLLQRTQELQDDRVIYRFSNGLIVTTDVFYRKDKLRVLGLGTPQASLMNHLLSFPDVVTDKDVFEPFAGSGALGLMALKVGARRVDFLDINPRAVAFQMENATLNGFAPRCYRAIEADIATFTPDRKYDLILANPPFVPTPEGIEGTITSNGGADGNRFVETLLKRLDELLQPTGQAFIYLFQLVRRGEPLVVELLSRYLDHRSVELTPAQARPISFDVYCEAYTELFPRSQAEIVRWRSVVITKHGDGVMLDHYIAHVAPRGEDTTGWVIRNNFQQKYGADLLVPFRDDTELAYGRIFENVVDFEAR